jgi:6-phosphogluconolactonase (cycloisomerase 2 family)
MVVTANYGGGDLSVFGIERGGGLTPLRQVLRLPEGVRGNHMHCVKFSPDGRWLFAADLGADKIARWRVRRGKVDVRSLKTFDVPEGSGPRHFVFDRAGENLYLINELSGTVIVFGYDNGELRRRQIVQADRAEGHGSADIVGTPDGRFLYTSHRLKNDGVAVFSVSPGDGTLVANGYVGTGVHPRNLAITPDGRFLTVAARDDDSVEFFAIDSATGELTRTGRKISLSRPVCVVFVEAIPAAYSDAERR